MKTSTDDKLMEVKQWSAVELSASRSRDVWALVNLADAAQDAKNYLHCVTEPPCGDCGVCRFHLALTVLNEILAR